MSKFSLLLILFSFFLGSISTKAQNLLDQRLDFDVQAVTVADALLELSEAANINIAFRSQLFDPSLKINLSLSKQTVRQILNQCLQQTDVAYKIEKGRILLYQKAPAFFTLSGYIQDAGNGERLAAATIYDLQSGKGTTSNDYGFFSLRLPAGKMALQVSYLGYQVGLVKKELAKNRSLTIDLQPSLTLEEVVVTDKLVTDDNLQLMIGQGEQIDPQLVLKLPATAGESDLFSYLQMKPNVQSGADGLGGLNVRGGSSDQNLVLLDGVPVFNPSHTIGLFSIFNTNIIKSSRFLTDGFSSRYGGRLSSVLDIRTREGNIKNYEGEIALSSIATKGSVEGPLVKGKSGFLLSFRRSHIDPIIKSISQKNKKKELENGETGYHFYDINAKLHWQVSEKDRLYLSLYKGGDEFTDETNWDYSFQDEFEDYFLEEDISQSIEWGNSIGALRWNHLYGDNLFSNATLTYSKYNYQSQNKIEFFENDNGTTFQDDYFTLFRSIIQDASLKMDFDYYPNEKHRLLFGGGFLWRRFEPGSIQDSLSILSEFEDIDDFIDNSYTAPRFSTQEIDLYVEDHYQLNSSLSLLLGAHGAGFITAFKTYYSFQPRLGLYWKAPSVWRGNLSISRMTQFLHVLSSTGAGLPSDLWVPSTDKIGPQHSLIGAGALEARWGEGFKLKTAAYYKKMKGLIIYNDEATLPSLSEIDPLYWEDEVTVGTGRAYGLSIELAKTQGKTSGWISYGWSRSWRTFELTNDGQEFPYTYDRPHQLKVYLRQQLFKKLSLSATWQYSSGQAITLIKTDQRFLIYENVFVPFTERVSSFNGYRMPDYHRLDISLQYEWKDRLQERAGRQWEHSLHLGVYNAYNRKNPYYMYIYDNEFFEEDNGLKKQNTLPILPSLTYRLRFAKK